jgi:Zn/Cd-binding protein ZinT
MYSKKVKKKGWTAIITIGLSILLTASVQAETSSNIFSDWEGEYLSREFVNENPKMDEVYKKTAIEGQKIGKNYTVEQIRVIFKKMMHTSFQRLAFKSDTIAFYDKEKNMTKHRYKAAGTIPDSYGDYKFEWYAFEAVGKDAGSSEYRHILMLKPHQHQNGQPHFHLRYGNKEFKELIASEGMKNWWPTLVKPDFDIDVAIKNVNPKIMVKVLP